MQNKPVNNRSNQYTGRIGENAARQHLLRLGLSVMETNYRTPFGEIDLIAADGEYTVFVEVKCRVSDGSDSPLYAIDDRKKRHIIKNALYYLKTKRHMDTLCRIDAVGVTLNETGACLMVEHVRNAIQFENTF